MGAKVRVTINGELHEAEPGQSILSLLGEAGVHVPHLCHDPRLAPAAVCRLCLVELAPGSRPVPACATPVAEGMAISTHTEALEAERRMALRLLAWSCPPDAPAGTPFRE